MLFFYPTDREGGVLTTTQPINNPTRLAIWYAKRACWDKYCYPENFHATEYKSNKENHHV